MARYIDAEMLIEHLKDNIEECETPNVVNEPVAYGTVLGLECALSYAETLPTADVAEVRHGRWKRVRWVKCDDPDGGYWIVRCNQCSIPHFKKYNFCPSCGARMDGDEDD